MLLLLGITEHDNKSANHEADNITGKPSNVDNHIRSVCRYGPPSLQRRRDKTPNNFRQLVIATVYNDQSESRQRDSSLIIAGLSEDQQYSDIEQFQHLCRVNAIIGPSSTEQVKTTTDYYTYSGPSITAYYCSHAASPTYKAISSRHCILVAI